MTNDEHHGAVALVTGANKGIGKEIVRRLAAEGMIVYLGARDEERGRAAVRDLTGAGEPSTGGPSTAGGSAGGAPAGEIKYMQLDVTDAEQVAAAAKLVERAHGRLDVLVNNAGVCIDWGIEPDRFGADELRRAYEVNVFGVAEMTRAAIPLLRQARAARVVNLSSPLGSLTLMSDPTSVVSTVRLFAYNSSKAALNALTVLYANVLRPDGIMVNAANPGLTGTDLNGMDPGRDGVRTVAQGAEVPVRLALLGPDGPSGRFFGDDDNTADGIVPW